MDTLVAWFVAGIVAGGLVKLAGGGSGPGAIVGDICVGVIGALAGGFLFDSLLRHSYNGWIGATGFAIAGAVILLSAERYMTGRPQLLH